MASIVALLLEKKGRCTKVPYQGAPHLIVVAKEPWGNVDFLELCKLASEDGVVVHYIGTEGGRNQYFEPEIVRLPLVGAVRFSALASMEIRRIYAENEGADIVVHVRYYKLCSLLCLFNRAVWRKMYVDVRSLSIKANVVVRWLENRGMTAETAAFAKRTVISNAVAAMLGIKSRYIELPLGAPESFLDIHRTRRSSSQLRFIYIGTLRQRNIHQFADIFARFISDHGLDWLLDIYGYGDYRDVDRLLDVSGRTSNVRYHGYIGRERIPAVLSTSDVGVSWIPITDYFDHQPPTKTYEYLLAGMPVLGTKTSANIRIVDSKCGWLCDDNVAGLVEALEAIRDDGADKVFDRHGLRRHTWRSIFERVYKKEIIGR